MSDLCDLTASGQHPLTAEPNDRFPLDAGNVSQQRCRRSRASAPARTDGCAAFGVATSRGAVAKSVGRLALGLQSLREDGPRPESAARRLQVEELRRLVARDTDAFIARRLGVALELCARVIVANDDHVHRG
ncbi:MAG: hypothetical protein U0575_00300 [Phycisphaerales bacterium]